MPTGRTKPDRTILSPQQLTRLLAGRRAQVIDIRIPGQWEQAHIRGSRNVDVGDLAGEVVMLDRELPIVLYDNEGESAAEAAEALRAAGITAFSLHGGLDAWVANGNPVEGEGLAPGAPVSTT